MVRWVRWPNTQTWATTIDEQFHRPSAKLLSFEARNAATAAISVGHRSGWSGVFSRKPVTIFIFHRFVQKYPLSFAFPLLLEKDVQF